MHKTIWVPVGFLILIFSLLALRSAALNGQTTDEAFFSASGYAMLRFNNYEFLGEQPPLASQIGAIPLAFLKLNFPIDDPWLVPGTDRIDVARNGRRFLYLMGNDPATILFLQRIPIIFLTALLGIGIYAFGRQLFGTGAALLALALFAFDPNILAHGSLYTTDMGLTFFYFVAIYAASRFFENPSDRTGFWLGLACGAAFMSKVSSLILLPILAVLFLVYYWTVVRGSTLKAPSGQFEKWILGLSIFLIANAIGEKQAMVMFGPFLIPALYLCARDLAWIRASRVRIWILRALFVGGAVLCAYYAWRLKKKYGVSVGLMLSVTTSVYFVIIVFLLRLSSSDKKLILVKRFLFVWVLAAAVIVFGYTDIAYKIHRFIGFGNYMKPLGIVLSHSAGGHGVCVEGSFVTCDWRYFPALMAVKTPLLTLMLALGGAVVLLFSKRSFMTKAIILLPACMFLGAGMMNKIRIGLRHILPVYPFLFLLAGYAGSLTGKIPSGIWRKLLAGFLVLMLIWTALRTVSMGPDYLAYFNEWVGGPERGARLVADSNLNWGQDNYRLAEFVRDHGIQHIKIMDSAMNPDVYDYYGIAWSRFGESDLIQPGPGFYALGIGVYARLYSDLRQSEVRMADSDPQSGVSWFGGRLPTHKIGKTFYVFQVPPRSSDNSPSFAKTGT